MIRVAVDGMGGDYAPRVVVDGAVLAANDFADLEIVLVGQPEALKKELNRHKVVGGKIIIESLGESLSESLGIPTLDFHSWQSPAPWVFWGLSALAVIGGFLGRKSTPTVPNSPNR